MAGAIDKNVYLKTESGTPQGGVISPTLANFALAGLEEFILNQKFNKKTSCRKGRRKMVLMPKINVVRYADDFIVSCRNKTIANSIVEACDEFLKPRGLELNREKTKITLVRNGFDFLGFHGQLWSSGLRITPSVKSLNRIKEKIRNDLLQVNVPPGVIVRKLNASLRG